jgi:putative glutamate/gamma-aminobutyrate antiporter
MKQSKKSLSIFLLLMINLSTVLSLRNWPITAIYGYTSIFYLLLSAALFFIPCALVAAELATLFPEKGGVFVWIKEALGHRFGFLGIWLLWISNIVFYPALLSFISASIAYTFFPGLADHPTYTFCMINGVFWLVTIVNLKGIHFTGTFSSFCVIVGTFVPAALILVLGAVWVLSGKEAMVTFESTPLVPNFSTFSTFSVLTGILLSFAGLEMPAIHAGDVENPKRSFPIAILLSAAIIVILTILGTLCIAIVIPRSEISFVSGTIEAMSVFLTQYELGFIMPIVAILIAIGALGGLSNWVVGPCRGLLASAEKGDFPPFMQKTNRNEMPYVLMFMQAIFVSCLSFLYIYMPNVSSSFWLLTVLAAQLYIIMYIMMFISGIVLKYKKPNAKRAYSVPGGITGMWITSGLGLFGVTFSLVIGFFPPPDVTVQSNVFFISFLFIGIISMLILPMIIYALKKPSWVSK